MIAIRLFVMSLQWETEGRPALIAALASLPSSIQRRRTLAPTAPSQIIGGLMSSITWVLFCLLCLAPLARAQTSRAASAASYLERGNAWLAKAEWDRAIADYDIAIAFDARAAV